MADTCKSCGAPILWCQTMTGRRMPVDANPNPDGNIELVDNGGVLLALPAPKAKPEPDLFSKLSPPKRYTSHFATCAHAEQWRKR